MLVKILKTIYTVENSQTYKELVVIDYYCNILLYKIIRWPTLVDFQFIGFNNYPFQLVEMFSLVSF